MDIVGIIAVTFLFGGGTLVGLAFSPVGRAFTDRIRHGKQPLPAPEVDPAIYEELDMLRTDVSELQERVEFAERLIAKAPPAPEEAGT